MTLLDDPRLRRSVLFAIIVAGVSAAALAWTAGAPTPVAGDGAGGAGAVTTMFVDGTTFRGRLIGAFVPVAAVAASIAAACRRGRAAFAAVGMAVAIAAWFDTAVAAPMVAVLAGGATVWTVLTGSGIEPDRVPARSVSTVDGALLAVGIGGVVWGTVWGVLAGDAVTWLTASDLVAGFALVLVVGVVLALARLPTSALRHGLVGTAGSVAALGAVNLAFVSRVPGWSDTEGSPPLPFGLLVLMHIGGSTSTWWAATRLARAADREVQAFLSSRSVVGMSLPPGVNLLGYHSAASGLGVAVRQLRASLEAAGVPVSVFDRGLSDSPTLSSADGSGVDGHDRPGVDPIRRTTIAVVTALELPAAAIDYPALFDAGQIVGYWFWELEAVPESHRSAVDLVDEIWAPTRFIESAYSDLVRGARPVRYQPMYLAEPVLDEQLRATWRRRLAPADEFVFLVTLDLFSIVERKNPFAAIDAFGRCFDRLANGPRDQPARAIRLVIKTLNGAHRPESLERIRSRVAASTAAERIEIIDEFVSDDDMSAMTAAADCLVSLHRGEGLGLHLAAAMWLGTPVIASRYSGNLDFMDDESAALIDVEMIDVEFGEGAYPDRFRWADPNVVAAADWMCRLVADGGQASALAEAARRRMEAQGDGLEHGQRYRRSIVSLDATE